MHVIVGQEALRDLAAEFLGQSGPILDLNRLADVMSPIAVNPPISRSAKPLRENWIKRPPETGSAGRSVTEWVGLTDTSKQPFEDRREA